MDCLFCKIVENKISSKIIHENDYVKVFLDVNPESTGHILIIPKKHFTNLDDIDINTLTNILKTAKEMKKLIEKKLKPDGIKLVQNNGIIQEIKHFHLHMIPYYSIDKKYSIDEVYNILTK